MSDAPLTFSEFRRLASQGNVVPVCRTIAADLLTPVSAFLKLAAPAGATAKARPYRFLLESVEGGEHVGRYTFFGMDPFQIVSCRGNQISLVRGARRS